MKEKLEALLSDVPGEFEHYPERVAGFDQLVIFRNNGIPCPDFTVEIAEARKWVALGNDVFGRNRVHEKGRDIVSQNSPAWADKEFWCRVIPNVKREYRVHIFDGKRIQQGLKWFDSNAVETSREYERVVDAKYLEEIRAEAKQFSTKLLSRQSRVAECAIRHFKNGKNTIKPRTLRKLKMAIHELQNKNIHSSRYRP